ncbi:unnamed protein product, partial [Prorocentrum cordatum]
GAGRLRLILDTRLIYQEFTGSDTVNLPSAGCWRGLRIQPADQLRLAQMDVEAAFYRIQCPPGLEEMMILPRIRRQDLLAARPDIDLDGVGGKVLAPRLLVAPMGWSWSLCFCESLVEAHVAQAGFGTDRQIADGKVIPDLSSDAAAASHVDGVAAVGSCRSQNVEKQLMDDHLVCKGIESPKASHKFTGLTFDQEAAAVSLSPSRLWRLRLGLRELADRGFCSGDEMLQVLGHCTWTALLRRGLLSIFSMSYKFADWAGPRRRRLWKGVAAELWAASALIAFAFCDAKRVVDPGVLVSDASTGEGAGRAPGFGGYGVAEKRWGVENVWATVARCERWRCAAEGAVQARGLALGLGAEACKARRRRRGPRAAGSSGGADFLQRAACGSRFLILCDNVSVTSGVEKGRSSSNLITQTVREITARSIFFNVAISVRWIASEHDAADKVSRTIGRAPRGPRSDPRHAHAGDGGEQQRIVERAWERELEEAALARAAGLGGVGLGPELGEADQVPEGGGATAHAEPRRGSLSAGALNRPTLLQRCKVQEHAQQVFDREFDALAQWSGRNDLPSLGALELDMLVARCLDHLYWSGFTSAKGSRVPAALHHRRPGLGEASSGGLPGSRAALAGFRRRSHAASRLPLAKPWMLGIPGVSLTEGDTEFAVALFLAWGGLLRLPGDLTSTAAEDWVAGPGCQSAIDHMPQSVLQERMRHGSAPSTLGRRKRVRYFRELEKAPSAIQQWTNRIEGRPGPLLLGKG